VIGRTTAKLPSTSAAFDSQSDNEFEDILHDDDDDDDDDNDVMQSALERPAATQGAVIALSIGIALTALLIIFIACRFCGRGGLKRSWKGQKLNVDSEADYLVDGMYLWYIHCRVFAGCGVVIANCVPYTLLS